MLGKRLVLTFLIFAISFLMISQLHAETLNGVEILAGEWRGQQIEYLDREILIGLKSDKSQGDLEAELAGMPVEVVRNADRFGFMKLKVDDNVDLFYLIELIDKLPSVRYAEPNMVDRLFVTPNDSLYNTQWHYHNIGQIPPGGTFDADIDAPEGWDITTGSDTIIVGVLDSGIPMQNGELSHPDLDDTTRYLLGIDVVNNDMEPLDDNGHGTHVSGTIAAESNNGHGVAGVAWNVKVMAIKVFSASGSGSHEYFRDGCVYGVDNGCKVLNYSGGGSEGATKEHGVAYADSNGVVLCAAAGNNNQGSVSWPGAYSLQYSNTICVSSTDHNDASSPFSSIGPSVTVAAPGGHGSPYDADDIQSTFPNYPCYLTTNYGLPEDYSPLAGTSMATPHVAGFAALILSMNPELTPDSVRQIMMNTADDLGPLGFDNQFGYGRINIFSALSQMGSVIITHVPLEDTPDTLNDYTVDCTIWSQADLVPSALTLNYEINSTWYQETLVSDGSPNGYTADIPAQPAGTTINYYLYAENIDGDADTTDTYSFYVIDYGVDLQPDDDTDSAPALDTVFYPMQVTNLGVFDDQYDLSVIDNVWNTTIWDAGQTTQITQTPSLYSGQNFQFFVIVEIPSSLEGEFDIAHVIASSPANPSSTDTSDLTTVSAGQPWEIPFSDDFITTTFEIAKWESTEGAVINTVGIDEPSPLYSANLNGDPNGGDALITEMINLGNESNVIIRYFYQQTGDGESPDANDDLIIEYMDADSNWNEINRHLGADPDMTEFVEVEMPLPAEAYHAGFRLQIRCEATSGAYDDWFVDDIYVGHPSDYDVAVNPSFQSEYGPAGDYAVYQIQVANDGFLQDLFDLTYSSNWIVEFYDATGTNQITQTPLMAGGDTTEVVVKVHVPPGTPLHVAETSTVYATSQGDNNISAYALIETVSAGTPAGVPWYETVPDDTLHTSRWFTYSGVDVTTLALNEPTEPYSFNLDGGGDTLVTQVFDLSGMNDVLLSYFYQRTGAGDAPEAGDNLVFEYRNSSGVWTNLATYQGAGELMEEFEYAYHELPADAMHSNLQIRIISEGSDPGEDDWYVDNIRVDMAPGIATTPGSFSKSLTQGDSSSAELVIENTGLGELLYSVRVNPYLNKGDILAANGISEEAVVVPASREYPAELYDAFVEKGEDLQFMGEPMEANIGGPDDYGYYWIDSDESGGPIFDWIDISSTGQDIVDSLDDDSYAGPYNLGFDFTFYGVTYNQIYIGSNGLIGFDDDGMSSRIARPIPTTTVPNNFIAWMWDDLDPTDDENSDIHVYLHSNSERCIIQFQNYPEYRANPGDVITAQVIIRADGTVKLQYKDIGTGMDLMNCAVGLENQNGTDGLEVVYMAGYLKENLAVEFFKPYDWLLLGHSEGLIAPGGSDTIDCQFVTVEDLEVGLYEADIMINSNDPGNPSWPVHAQLEVLPLITYICGDANGDDEVNVSDAVYIVNFVFVSGQAPDPMESADVNCDTEVNVSDAVYIINSIFAGGPAPCSDCPQ